MGEAETAPKKKRGRKKKEAPTPNDLAPLQPAVESTAAEGMAGEEPAKKKRGRPRKSDPPKTAPLAEELSPAPATEGRDVDFDIQPSNQADDTKAERNASEVAPPASPPEKKPGRRGRKRKQPGSGTLVEKEEADGGARAEKTAPGEISNNSQGGAASMRRSQSPDLKTGRVNKRSLGEDSSPDAQEENSDGRRVKPKEPLAAPAKEADKEPSPATPGLAPTTTKTTPGAGNAAGSATGKVRYRVGLSRKSHIAPLLKSLKK